MRYTAKTKIALGDTNVLPERLNHIDKLEFTIDRGCINFSRDDMSAWIHLGKTPFDREVKGVAELAEGRYVIKTSVLIRDKELRKKIIDALKLDGNATFSNKRYRVYQITLTGEELDAIDDYAFEKANRLKESGSDDKRYQVLMSVHRKLQEAKKK